MTAIVFRTCKECGSAEQVPASATACPGCGESYPVSSKAAEAPGGQQDKLPTVADLFEEWKSRTYKKNCYGRDDMISFGITVEQKRAADIVGGQDAGCKCGSHDLAPLYHHPKCALAPAAPSERGDEKLSDDLRITVCAACKQASCWQGVFFCDRYQSAGTMELTVAELRQLDLEHPSYWAKDQNAGTGLSSQEGK